MKMNTIIFTILLFAFIFFAQTARAENIHFNNDIYELKSGYYSDTTKGYTNEYFVESDTSAHWEKKIGIYYYPEVKDPIKFANEDDKKIEAREGVVLLKFIANKKQDKAVISFLENGEQDGRKFFEHNIYKYEPHPEKGMMVLKYSKRFFFNTDSEITNIGHEVKKINDDLMEQIIISPIPPIVEQAT